MTGIDDLTYVIEEAVRDAEGGSYYPTVDFRRAARDSLTAIQSVLRERGVLLGPDGLVKATPTGRYLGTGSVHHRGQVHDNPTCNCGSTLNELYTLIPETHDG